MTSTPMGNTSLAYKKDKHDIPYAAGNRHHRRTMLARNRGKYMRDKHRAAQFEEGFRKDAIAERVEKQQGAAHARAVARREAKSKAA